MDKVAISRAVKNLMSRELLIRETDCGMAERFCQRQRNAAMPQSRSSIP